MFKQCLGKPIMLLSMVSLFLACVIGGVGVENAYAHACGVCDACIACQPCEELNYYITPTSSDTPSTLVTGIGSGFAASAPIRIDFGTTIGITSCVSNPDGTFEASFTANPTQPGPTTVLACCECSECQAGAYCSSQECESIFSYTPHIPTLSEWGLIIMGLLLLTVGAVVIWRRLRTVSA